MTVLCSFVKLHRAGIRETIGRLFWDCVRSEHGVAAVEFAIFAPALILMTIGTADLALGIYSKMRVQNAAQFGTQYAVTHGFDSASVTDAVLSNSSVPGLSVTPAPYEFCGCATGTGIGTVDCSSPCPDGSSSGVYVSVSTQGTYNTILPYPLIPDSYTFAAQATVRVE
jgi:Flp pilus assembly protein TadG